MVCKRACASQSAFPHRNTVRAAGLQAVHRVITRHLLGQAGLKADDADSGAVTLIQPFGSAANLNGREETFDLPPESRHPGAPTYASGEVFGVLGTPWGRFLVSRWLPACSARCVRTRAAHHTGSRSPRAQAQQRAHKAVVAAPAFATFVQVVVEDLDALHVADGKA